MPNPNPPKLLIVDDDSAFSAGLAELLTEWGYASTTARSAAKALDALRGEPHQAVVMDLNLPDRPGLDLLQTVQQEHPTLPVVVITGFGRLDAAVQAMRLGAVDFLTKPIMPNDLEAALKRALQRASLLATETKPAGHPQPNQPEAQPLLGASPAMHAVREWIPAAAESDQPAWISGAPGSGRRTLAHRVHLASVRHDRPWVALDLRDLSPAQAEAKLLGADASRRKGQTRRASAPLLDTVQDGTLVLLEPTAWATPAWMRLTKLLDESTGALPRVIVVDPHAPAEAIAAKPAREATLRSWSILPIAMPSLRDRPGDAALLAEAFLERECTRAGKVRTFSPDTIQAMERHHWPGQVAELGAAIAHAVAVSPHALIRPEDLPAEVLAPSQEAHAGVAPALTGAMTLQEAMREPEREILRAALDHNAWNRTRTAKQLGIDRTTLYKKMRDHRLDRPA